MICSAPWEEYKHNRNYYYGMCIYTVKFPLQESATGLLVCKPSPSLVWLLKAKNWSNAEEISIVTILVSKEAKCFT